VGSEQRTCCALVDAPVVCRSVMMIRGEGRDGLGEREERIVDR